MPSVVAMNVSGTVMTMSPGCTPAAIRANRSASVPLLTPTQYLASQNLREFALEALHRRAADKPGGSQRLLKTFTSSASSSRC